MDTNVLQDTQAGKPRHYGQRETPRLTTPWAWRYSKLGLSSGRRA